MWSCDRKTELCRCKIENGETFCSLKISQITEVTEILKIPQGTEAIKTLKAPQVTASIVHQTGLHKDKQLLLREKATGKKKIYLSSTVDLRMTATLYLQKNIQTFSRSLSFFYF